MITSEWLLASQYKAGLHGVLANELRENLIYTGAAMQDGALGKRHTG